MTRDDGEDGTDDRPVDIEDQGQAVDAGEETDPDVESVEGGESDPGPEGAGAREATQKSGAEPTEIVAEADDSEDRE